MRLAVFTNMFPSPSHVFFARDMRALIDAGIEIDVFCLYPLEPRFWEFNPEILGAHVLPHDRLHYPNLGRALRATHPGRMLASRGFAGDAAAIALSGLRCGPVSLAKTAYAVPLAWQWAQEFGERFDHVLAYWGGYPGTCAYLFHRFAGRDIPFSTFLHSRTDLYGSQALLRQKLLYADTIISISEYNRRFLKERYGAIYAQIAPKIHVNYRGLDLNELPYRGEGRLPHRVLAVGRLHKEKGQDLLLHAIARLVARGVEVELELLGDGPERKALPALARRLGISDRVTFRGWLPFAEVREAMTRATVLANPSREDALPTVLEEATALGVPVVASNGQGAPELLDQGRGGVLVPPGDVAALTDAIGALLADPELRRGYAERARRHAERTLDMWANGARLAETLRRTRRGARAEAPVALSGESAA